MHVVPINVLEHKLSIQCVEQWLLKQRVEHKLLKSTCGPSTPNQRGEHRLLNQRDMND